MILVGIDGSAAAEAALRWAAAEAHRRGVGLLLVHVSDTAGLERIPAITLADGMSVYDRADAAGRSALDAAARTVAEQYPDLDIRNVQKAGAPSRIMVELSREAELTVVGATGLGSFGSLMLGTVAATLVSDGHSPIAVIRGDADGHVPTTGPVVLGVDVGETSETAIAWAFDEASRRGTDLLAVHAWNAEVDAYAAAYSTALGVDWEAEAEAQEAQFAERLAGWQEKFPDVRIIRALRAGRTAAVLLEEAAEAQLVVVGSRGHGNFTGALLGSVSRALIHRATCPVLVARNNA